MKIHSKLYVDGELKLHETNGFVVDRSTLESREDRLHHSVHAEINILAKDKFTGHKVLVMNLCPCWNCAKALTVSDINEIHIPAEIPERWRDPANSCVDGLNLLLSSGKKIVVMPVDSGLELE